MTHTDVGHRHSWGCWVVVQSEERSGTAPHPCQTFRCFNQRLLWASNGKGAGGSSPRCREDTSAAQRWNFRGLTAAVLIFCLVTCCLWPLDRVSPPFHHTLKQPNHLLCSRAGLQSSFPGSSTKFTFFSAETWFPDSFAMLSPAAVTGTSHTASPQPDFQSTEEQLCLSWLEKALKSPEQDSCGPVTL